MIFKVDAKPFQKAIPQISVSTATSEKQRPYVLEFGRTSPLEQECRVHMEVQFSVVVSILHLIQDVNPYKKNALVDLMLTTCKSDMAMIVGSQPRSTELDRSPTNITNMVM